MAEAKEKLVPPAIFLETTAGRQRAVAGKSCVLTVGQGRGEGAGSCTVPPRRPLPRELSVVRPGEVVRVLIPGTTIVERRGCVGRHECGGWATVRPLGCPAQETAFFELAGSETRWRATVPPGAYEVDVSIDFRTEAQLTGDADAVAGLLVDAGRERGLVPFAPDLLACQASAP